MRKFGSFLGCCCWFLCGLYPLGGALGQEANDRKPLHARLYSNMEAPFKEIANSNIKLGVDAAKKHQGRPLNAEEMSAIKWGAVRGVYQRAIDTMVCAEKFAGGAQFSKDEMYSCLDDRRNSTAEMFKFMSEYGHLDIINLALTRCLAKTRLLNMEVRYPPFNFMRALDEDASEAHDAKSFLECAKSRL